MKANEATPLVRGVGRALGLKYAFYEDEDYQYGLPSNLKNTTCWTAFFERVTNPGPGEVRGPYYVDSLTLDVFFENGELDYIAVGDASDHDNWSRVVVDELRAAFRKAGFTGVLFPDEEPEAVARREKLCQQALAELAT